MHGPGEITGPTQAVAHAAVGGWLTPEGVGAALALVTLVGGGWGYYFQSKVGSLASLWRWKDGFVDGYKADRLELEKRLGEDKLALENRIGEDKLVHEKRLGDERLALEKRLGEERLSIARDYATKNEMSARLDKLDEDIKDLSDRMGRDIGAISAKMDRLIEGRGHSGG